MKRKMIAAACMAAMLLPACGSVEDEGFKLPDTNISDTERPTFAPKDDKDEGKDEDIWQDNDIDLDIMNIDVSDGDSMMELELAKFGMKSDANGFKISGTILLDYEGSASEVHIPEGITGIAPHACWSNDSIRALYIPSTVEKIGEGAFWSCGGLEYVKAEEGLKEIGSTAFWSCSSLETVELPKSVEKISDDVFWAISELTICAPEDSYAFKFAENNGFSTSTSGTNFVISNEKTITAGQYRYEEFEQFTIPDDVKGIDAEAFQYCDQLKSINIPANIKYIGSNAFEYCDSLKTVNIASCPDIKAEAFEYCENLKSVRIGEGCVKIGSSAFAYCDSLSEIFLPASLESISDMAFYYCSPDLKLHVPSGSYAEEFAKNEGYSYDNNMR